MATIVLFHHAGGRTPGVLAIVRRLEEAGHTVVVPDYFDGITFTTMGEALAHLDAVSMPELFQRAEQAVAHMEQPFVVAGISLGAALAQHLAHTDARVQGLVSLEGFIDPQFLAGGLPQSLPITIHGSADDPFFAEDLPAAQAVAASHPVADLHLYEGCGHLFTDDSWDTNDASQTDLVLERVQAFLDCL